MAKRAINRFLRFMLTYFINLIVVVKSLCLKYIIYICAMKINIINALFISFILAFIACDNSGNGERVLKEPTTVEELGELLFHDSILSRENQVSCASCHKPEFAFADNIDFSFGVDSAKGGRNTPSAM